MLKDLSKELISQEAPSARPQELISRPRLLPRWRRRSQWKCAHSSWRRSKPAGPDLPAASHPLATTSIIIIFVVSFSFNAKICATALFGSAGFMPICNVRRLPLQRRRSGLGGLFLTQLILNSAFGVVIGLRSLVHQNSQCDLSGAASPQLYASVPYIGAVIAAASRLLWRSASIRLVVSNVTLALFLVVEPIVGPCGTSDGCGHGAGLSPVAVVAAATFWTRYRGRSD